MNGTEQQLDVILIEDKYGLSEQEIWIRVADIVAEKASFGGWKVSSIVKKNEHPVKLGEFLRYEYNIFGEVVTASVDIGDVNNVTNSSDTNGVAAGPVDLDL